MTGRAPAFQLYANDWLSSTKIALMSPAQEGGYFRLLCHAWNDKDCSLPDDDDQLAILSRLGEAWFNGGSTVVRRCFEPHPQLPGKLVNTRLLAERVKQDEWREKSRIGGLKSGAARAKQNKVKDLDTMKGGSRLVGARLQAGFNQNATLQSSSSSSNTQGANPETHTVTLAKPVPTVSEEESRLNSIEGMLIQLCGITFISPPIERQLMAAVAAFSQTQESIARIKEFCDSRTKVQALNYVAQNFMQWVGNANREQAQQPKSKTYCGVCVKGWVMPTGGERTATRCQCVNQGKEQQEVMA